MKNRKSDKADYSKLKTKIFLRMCLIILLSIALVAFFRLFTYGKIADPIVKFFQYTFSLDFNEAVIIYQYVLRNNIQVFTIIAVVICFLVLSRYLITQFLKYFNEINTSIDDLINNEDKEVSLSPELDFIKKKLETLKRTLEERANAAQQAEQKKNDLVMYLAHDIKTPLTSVIGYLSLLDEVPDMPMEQKAKYVHITLEKAYRLEKLINEFFEITRYNLQNITLQNESVDLYYLLMQMTDELYPLLIPSGKTITINSDERIDVFGDSNHLARVFNNILKNAIAYSDTNSAIRIDAQLIGNTVIVQFKNQGRLIPKEKLSRIFEQFYRLDSSRSANTGGAGLGLAIAKEIVVLHGGEIYAESNVDYTTLTVKLPAMPINAKTL